MSPLAIRPSRPRVTHTTPMTESRRPNRQPRPPEGPRLLVVGPYKGRDRMIANRNIRCRGRMSRELAATTAAQMAVTRQRLLDDRRLTGGGDRESRATPDHHHADARPHPDGGPVSILAADPVANRPMGPRSRRPRLRTRAWGTGSPGIPRSVRSCATSRWRCSWCANGPIAGMGERLVSRGPKTKEDVRARESLQVGR
jgi:hypothetical protein